MTQKWVDHLYELIVVDDGSIDDTPEIVRQGINTIKGNMRCCSTLYAPFSPHMDPHPYAGAKALNFGIHKARGEWIIKLDSDDVLVNNAISVFLQIYRTYPTDIFSVGMMELWEETGIYHYLPPKKIVKEEIFVDNQIFATSPFRKEIWEKVGGFREVIMEDWDFWNRAILKEARVELLNFPFYIKRERLSNMTHILKRDPEREKKIDALRAEWSK